MRLYVRHSLLLYLSLDILIFVTPTMAALMTRTGAAVDSSPTPTPAMMLVPWPVVLASAMRRTGSNVKSV